MKEWRPDGWENPHLYFGQPHTMVDIDSNDRHSAYEAGADAIQLHGAHGYLINEFISPFYNRRKDDWGGTEENRFRYLKELINSIKKVIPGDMAFLIKLNSIDYTPKEGITPSIASKYAEWLVKLGIDGIEIVYPQDFSDPKQTVAAVKDSGLAVSAVNLNVKSEKKWQSGSFTAMDPQGDHNGVFELHRFTFHVKRNV